MPDPGKRGDLVLSVLAATHDGETRGELFARLEPQPAAIGGEVLVADGSEDPITSVPMARGRVIALTERTSFTR